MMEKLEIIGLKIKHFRKLNSLTQQELANKLIVSRERLAKWETNETSPDIESLIKISDLFDVTIDNLVGNQTLKDDLIKEFTRIYGREKSFDDELLLVSEILLKHPELKEQILKMKNLNIDNQKYLFTLIENYIDHHS